MLSLKDYPEIEMGDPLPPVVTMDDSPPPLPPPPPPPQNDGPGGRSAPRPEKKPC